MIAKVIKSDESVIYNSTIYSYGEEFEIDDSIGKSLIERGLIEVSVFEENNIESEKPVIRADIEGMSYPELKSYASELGLSASGKKEELIKRIKEHFADAEEAEVENDEEADELPDTSMPE